MKGDRDWLPNDIFGECNWTSGMKFSDYYVVLRQKLHICTYADKIFTVTGRPLETAGPQLPPPSGDSRTAPDTVYI